jgi:tetratricopeptide (TPR) repeat protein
MAGRIASVSRTPRSPDSEAGESDTGDLFTLAAARLRAQRPLRNPRLRQIARDLRGADAIRAEQDLRTWLQRHIDDADAIFLMAQATARRERGREAVSLLERCLEIASDFSFARYSYAKLLVHLHRSAAARTEIAQLRMLDPVNPLFRQLEATVLAAVGEDEQSLMLWRGLAEDHPERGDLWIRCGDGFRAIGRQAEALAAYRRAIACRASFGLAWWSLANMKTVSLGEADIRGMSAALSDADAGPEDRANLLFALGKAYEDRGDWAKSFEHYARGNAARRLRTDYDWDDITSELATQKGLYTRGFLESRRSAGCTAKDPIFILGRPRSGSTLIEQILSSHSAIEGTAELPYITDGVWRLLEGECAIRGIDYPRILAELAPAALTAMGEEYMDRSRVHRKLGRPFFIDKAPANYHHVGLLLQILPNAKIIDSRRNPAACCFSMFKHNYNDTNLRLGELGRVYRNYVELMAHFDHVASGRIHRVIYEEMVADPETEIRRLLGHLELPFEENCLRFHETERAVRTPSSEQVRRPISGEAVAHWRHFEPWLGPLLDSLGTVLTDYPRVPEELR